MIILGVLLFLIGCTMLIVPALFWNITESWKSNDASEPSKLYKVSTRFGGIMFILVGAGLFITYL